MSFNTFGHMFRVTTFGESHGVGIGCVVDGCPPGIPLKSEEIQAYLDKRRPGQSRESLKFLRQNAQFGPKSSNWWPRVTNRDVCLTSHC